MKRFWLVLLSLGLIVAFSTSAMAVDLKFSGEFYAGGMYLDKTSFRKDTASDGPSTAFFFQRLRLNTTFVVHPGLFLITRADILERSWGAQRSDVPLITANDMMSAGTRAENENIVFDLAYLQYISPIGIFSAGYQIDGAYGTTFGDNSLPTGKVGYMLPIKGFYIGVQTGQNNEYSRRFANTADAATVANALAADRDSSFYTAYVNYVWKTGSAGFLYKYIRSAASRNVFGGDNGLVANLHVVTPFVKAQLGPVFVQGQLYHIFGQQKFEGPAMAGRPDTRYNSWSGWVDATADFGMFYGGGSIAYVSGQDPGAGDIKNALSGGMDWKPCLILFNSDLNYWTGGQTGYNNAANGASMTNAYFFQVRAGARPIDKLDIGLAVAYANADKKPTAAWLFNDYGYEVDLTATYKITNNLSYMLGGGYLFTGKYFKGASDLNQLRNDFLVINKLTLTF